MSRAGGVRRTGRTILAEGRSGRGDPTLDVRSLFENYDKESVLKPSEADLVENAARGSLGGKSPLTCVHLLSHGPGVRTLRPRCRLAAEHGSGRLSMVDYVLCFFHRRPKTPAPGCACKRT